MYKVVFLPEPYQILAKSEIATVHYGHKSKNFFLSLFLPHHGHGDLNSPARDGTCDPCMRNADS